MFGWMSTPYSHNWLCLVWLDWTIQVFHNLERIEILNFKKQKTFKAFIMMCFLFYWVKLCLRKFHINDWGETNLWARKVIQDKICFLCFLLPQWPSCYFCLLLAVNTALQLPLQQWRAMATPTLTRTLHTTCYGQCIQGVGCMAWFGGHAKPIK